jgi:hypothetical protein
MKKNRWLLLLSTVIFIAGFIACNDNSVPEETVVVKDTVVESAEPVHAIITDEDRFNGEQLSKKYLVYEMDFDNETLDKNAEFNSANLQIDSIIKGLNYRFRDIPIEKIKLGGDTLYAKINNSTYLTEQMGSTGAAAYIAEAVVNITSVAGINYVNLNFKEGDHATPGVYAKKDYQKFHILK